MGGRRLRSAQAGAVVALLALAAASAALAASAPAGRRPSLDAQQLDTRTHQALLDLYALDSRLQSARARLASLEAAATRLQQRRSALRQELHAARATLKVSRHELALRLRALYEQGNVDPLAVVLGATSLGKGLRKLDDLTRVADESRRVVEVTQAAGRRLVHARLTLARYARRLTRSLVAARATEQSLSQAAAARTAYVASLRAQARLGQAQVSSIVSKASSVAKKSQQLQGPPPTQPSPDGRKLVVSATCYDLPGHTATGMPVGWGVVAVDPSVIPLGTKLYVPGYGNAVAADVGGAIKGAIIDLWMPYSKCMQWGRRTVTITIY